MWHKYTAKWGVQMPGMNFQTRSKTAGTEISTKLTIRTANTVRKIASM
ncbi:DUF6783 domain-containing protein [Otoolea muris]